MKGQVQYSKRESIGLLKTLDYHRHSKSGKVMPVEIEYQLYSWGGLYPPFIGGSPEHTLRTCYVLNNFPFKLFSYSPYGQLPQKLCLTFNKYGSSVLLDQHGDIDYGDYTSPDETAKEFAAFLSLVTRRRIFVDRQIRYEGLPIDNEVYFYRPSHFQERQRMKEIDHREIYQLMENLRSMDIGDTFITASRLYHSAVEMMYTEPEISYLFLVMSIETISFVIYKKEDVTPDDIKKDRTRTDLDKFLDSKYSGWRKFCNFMERKEVIDILLAGEHFDRRKFSKFITDNVPEYFWTDKEDDAKPYYLERLYAEGEQISHNDITIKDHEKIKKENLNKTLTNIYDARSKLVHVGKNLPANIINGHFTLLPFDKAIEMTKEEMNIVRLPPLLTFERLVSYSMVEFIRKYKKDNKKE